MHQLSGKNFTEWELFLRTNELKTYKAEKEKRDAVYIHLKEKIKEIKESSKGDQQVDKIIRERMKSYLFGNKFPVYKLEQDALLPQQHYIQLYIKATKSEVELDTLYKTTDSYMKYLISQTQQQIDILKEMMMNRKLNEKYEKKYFTRYYSNYSDLEKKLEDDISVEEQKERHNLLQTLALKRNQIFNVNLKTAELMKCLEKYAMIQGYDINNLSEEQIKDLDGQQMKLETEELLQKYFAREYEETYISKLSVFELKKREWKELEILKKKFAPDETELFQASPKGESPIKYSHLLSQDELNIRDLYILRQLVTEVDIEKAKNLQEFKEAEKNLFKQREKYELMLRRYFDRQVRKRDKADYNEILEVRGKIERPIKEENEKKDADYMH